jgi:hypothetical protein
MQATWTPHEKHGQLTAKGDLPDTVFAFPNQRKEPLTDAQHVRNAVARFDQVTGVSDAERALGVHPQAHRHEAAAKAAETRKREREERGG